MWAKKKEKGNEQVPPAVTSPILDYYYDELYAPELQCIAPFSFEPWACERL